VGADLEVLLLFGGGGFGRFELELGAAAAFVEGLHPQGFGHVGDGLGEAVQGSGAKVQPGGEVLPPNIEEGFYGVGGS